MEGPKIFHRLVVSLVAFPFKVEQKEIIESFIDWNSYFAHPKNVLLCMLTDEAKPKLRKKAANIIKSIKAQGKPSDV